MELNSFIEEKINHYATAILHGGAKIDEHAFGEITFYMALRRVLSGKGTIQDIGMMDAINDTLQEIDLLGKKKVFYK